MDTDQWNWENRMFLWHIPRYPAPQADASTERMINALKMDMKMAVQRVYTSQLEKV